MWGALWAAWELWRAVAVSAAAASLVPVFQKSCGNARPDMEICLIWNARSQRGSLSVVFHGEDRDDVAVTRDKGERAGIEWYVGSGTVQGARMMLWLRVDDSGSILPVNPRPPRTAAVFFRQSINQKWAPYPSSTQFLFSEVK